MQTKRYDLFFVCVCLALCAVLWLGMLIAGPAQARANEVLTAKPVLRSAEGWNARYLSDLADYVADRFFLRQTLVTAHNRLLTALGGGEAAGVIAGRDGWLYYAATLDDYTGADALRAAELICRDNIRAMVIDTEKDFISLHIASQVAEAMHADYCKVDELRGDQLRTIVKSGTLLSELDGVGT